MIPGKQIAGVTQQKRDDKKNNANDPVEFARCAISATIEDLEHVREDQEYHQLRRPAMQIAQKQSRRNHKLQILHVSISLRHRRMVIQHQQNAGDNQDEKRPQRKRAQVPRCAEAHHPFANLGREQMEEYVLLNGQCAV